MNITSEPREQKVGAPPSSLRRVAPVKERAYVRMSNGWFIGVIISSSYSNGRGFFVFLAP